MNHQELIEQLRKGFGTAAGRATQVNFYRMWCKKAANAIESLLAENERLKHNLTSTEQTMREYQELAAKRLEEIAKYRDAPVVAWVEVVDSYEGPYHFNGEKLLNVGKHKLIVKPGENK